MFQDKLGDIVYVQMPVPETSFDKSGKPVTQKFNHKIAFYGRSDDSHCCHIVISVIVVGGSDIFNWFF